MEKSDLPLFGATFGLDEGDTNWIHFLPIYSGVLLKIGSPDPLSGLIGLINGEKGSCSYFDRIIYECSVSASGVESTLCARCAC